MKKKNLINIEKISRESHIHLYKNLDLGKKKIVNYQFLQNLLKFKIKKNKSLSALIRKFNLEYFLLKKKDKEKINLEILKKLLKKGFTKTGNQKLDIWNVGWKENLIELKKNFPEALLPKYYRKTNRIFRLCGDIVFSHNYKFDASLQTLVHLSVLNTFCKNLNFIYEFGAGSGNVLNALLKFYKRKYNYYGLDWSSSSIQILKKIKFNKISIAASKFNFFKPNYNFAIQKNSLLLTNGALEQTGSNYKKFIKYILSKKPTLIINFEPISDYYINDNLNDYVLKFYTKKRNYLKNYIQYLESLAKKKKIQIIKKCRVGGGPYSESFSFVIWKIKV